jgi:hypothetical protein
VDKLLANQQKGFFLNYYYWPQVVDKLTNKQKGFLLLFSFFLGPKLWIKRGPKLWINCQTNKKDFILFLFYFLVGGQSCGQAKLPICEQISKQIILLLAKLWWAS